MRNGGGQLELRRRLPGIACCSRPLPALFGSYTRLLFVAMALLAVLAVALARYIQTSWIGRGLRAIRDNEEAAECVGVPTLKLKLFAATASGALMGVAGAPFPLYMSFIEPTSAFSLNYAVSALAMPIIGGTASWVGPVIGAVLLALGAADRHRDHLFRAQCAGRGGAAGDLRGRGAARHHGPGAQAVRQDGGRR